MSREDFSLFINALEHSYSLRVALKKCKTNKMILELANKNGFSLTINDLLGNSNSEKAEEWFIKSKLNPLKKNN